MKSLIVSALFLLPILSYSQEFLKDGSGYLGVGIVGEVKKSDFYGDIKREVHPSTQLGLQDYKLTPTQEFGAETIVSLQMNNFSFRSFDNYGSGEFFFDLYKPKKLFIGAGIRGALHLSPNPNVISTDPYSDETMLSATSESSTQVEIGYRDYDPKRIKMIAPVFGIKTVQGEKIKYQLGARTRFSMDENILLFETIYSKNFDTSKVHDLSACLGALMKVNKAFKSLKLPVDIYAGLDARITDAYLKTDAGDVVKTIKTNVGARLMVTFK